MSFWQTVTIAGVGLAILLYVTHLLLARFNKKSLSLSFALSHIIFIAVCSAIYFPGEKDAQHQLFWLLPAIFDLPISFIYPILSMGNMVNLALVFAILGTVQYAIIGWGIDVLLAKNKRQFFPTKRYVMPLLALIFIASFLAYRNISYIQLPDSEKSKIELSNAQTEKNRFYALNDAAKTHFEAKEYERAAQYATELLNLAQKYPNNWNYGNAIYDSHMVLGRVALLNNDIETAKDHLFLAVKTPGSPQLDSFGPNMSLANDLLEKGYQEPVIEFLNQCKRFWYDHKKVDEWVKEIKNDQIPDFGANLVY